MLEGKRTLVVGGGSGIGRGVVDAFVREGAQAAVLELSTEKCEALRTEHPDVLTYCGDSQSLTDCEAAVAGCVDAFGGLDVLVNCVGIFDFYLGLAEIAPDRLAESAAEMFAVNVTTHLVSVKAALAPLQAARGSVLLTSSTSGFYPGRGGVLYVASKFAVRGLVISLAHELAPEIRVNGVAPGGTVGTDLRGLRSLGLAERRLGEAPGRAESIRARTPLQVAMTPDDQAGAYVFLASDLSAGITGTFLHPDGGAGIK